MRHAERCANGAPPPRLEFLLLYFLAGGSGNVSPEFLAGAL